MLKFKITTKADLDEAAKLRRRRRFEEERKKAIYNAKKRLFGLDREALELQIAEKEQQRKKEQEEEQAYIEELVRQDRLQITNQKQLERERRLHEAEINCYRSTYQRKDQSSTYYLNETDTKSKYSAFPKPGEDNSRFGVSSAQIFSGDVPLNSGWKRVQKEQQLAWLDQQMEERRQAEEERKKSEKEMQEKMELKEHRLREAAALDKESRNYLIQSTRRYNQEMAAKKKAEKLQIKKQTAETDQAEIQNTLGSDMLMESFDVAESRTSLYKKIAYQYRGMTPEERQVFYKERKKQVEDKINKELDEGVKEKEWEQLSANMCRMYALDTIKRGKQAKEEILKLQQTNLELAKEQRERNQAGQKYALQPAATEEFFAQFNRGIR